MPFNDLSAEEGCDYIAEGICEDLRTDLSNVVGLRVASRNASMKGKASGTLSDVNRFSHVVEGSLRCDGRRLRVNAELAEYETGKRIWADRIDAQADDIFALQDGINANIVNALKLHLSVGVSRRGTTHAAAYDSYLRGRAQYYKYALPNMAKAIGYFEKASQIDPKFTLKNAVRMFPYPRKIHRAELQAALAEAGLPG